MRQSRRIAAEVRARKSTLSRRFRATFGGSGRYAAHDGIAAPKARAGSLDAPYLPPPEERSEAKSDSSDARALERLDRWIEGSIDESSTLAEPALGNEERMLLAGPADRLGKGAVRMMAAELSKEAAAAARVAAGEIARSAATKVARFFATKGERQALLTISKLPQRALAGLGRSIPAKVEAHVLEHTREAAGKVVHSLFEKGTSMDRIVELMRATLRSGARPILSVADDGALVFVLEREFPKAIGSKGEKALRMVVDLEGRLVTAFPFAAEKKLATLTVRGIAVAATVAPLFMLGSLAQSEAEVASVDAAGRREQANRTTWLEDVLAFVGPYGIFDSSPVAIEPNFSVMKKRQDAAIDEARSAFEREPTSEEVEAIKKCVHDAWADAAYGPSA